MKLTIYFLLTLFYTTLLGQQTPHFQQVLEIKNTDSSYFGISLWTDTALHVEVWEDSNYLYYSSILDPVNYYSEIKYTFQGQLLSKKTYPLGHMSCRYFYNDKDKKNGNLLLYRSVNNDTLKLDTNILGIKPAIGWATNGNSFYSYSAQYTPTDSFHTYFIKKQPPYVVTDSFTNNSAFLGTPIADISLDDGRTIMYYYSYHGFGGNYYMYLDTAGKVLPGPMKSFTVPHSLIGLSDSRYMSFNTIKSRGNIFTVGNFENPTFWPSHTDPWGIYRDFMIAKWDTNMQLINYKILGTPNISDDSYKQQIRVIEIDTSMLITAWSKKYVNGDLYKPVNTEAVFLAFNPWLNTHWQISIPLGGYCGLADFDLDSLGNIWAACNCTELKTNGDIKEYIKIFKIDSVLNLPRVPDSIDPVGLAEHHQNSIWKIYPNPGADAFTVHAPNGYTGQLYLYNLQGQVVLSTAIKQQKQIATSHLNDGIYIYRIISHTGELQTGRWVKTER